MIFADLHSHLLFGVDDGADSEETMMQMLGTAYAEGIRYLCLTPHYHKGYYGDNKAKSENAYESLCKFAEREYPDMALLLGNELHFSSQAIEWLRSGDCRTMGKTKCVLVDFAFDKSADDIIKALREIAGAGYMPILAHAERYSKLRISDIKELKQMGVLIQNNSGSFVGDFGFFAKKKAWAMVNRYLSDFVSTDAHDLNKRPIRLKRSYELIAKKTEEGYAAHLFKDHAVKLFFR